VRYLVTGGCGFIGSCIVKRLCADSRAQVTVLDNLSTGSRENLPGSCRFVEGDVNDRVVLERALEGVDVVLHEAAFVSIRGSFSRLEEDLRAWIDRYLSSPTRASNRSWPAICPAAGAPSPSPPPLACCGSSISLAVNTGRAH